MPECLEGRLDASEGSPKWVRVSRPGDAETEFDFDMMNAARLTRRRKLSFRAYSYYN
jgi:hypothetical protein